MNKREAAHLLRTMGKLLAVKGEDAFKVRSYERAADSIMAGDYDLAEMARAGRLLEIPNVGRNLEPKIREMVLTGHSTFLERLAAEVPEGLIELLNVPGIGAKTARLLHDSLGIKNLQDLKAALAEHKVRSIPGLGTKREDIMAKGLAEIERYAGRINLGLALPFVGSLVSVLREVGARAEAAGEISRYEETVGGLDIVLDPGGRDFGELMEKSGLVSSSGREALNSAWNADEGLYALGTSFHIPLRVHIACGDDFAARWTYTTGPGSYVEFLEKRAAEMGYSLNRLGLWREGRRVALSCDKGLHETLDLQYIPPELRHRPEASETALKKSLAPLVCPEDIKGDLHVHTSWSDGTAGIEAMVQKAVSLGYSCVAITDHATEIKMIKSVTPERLAEQAAEIRKVSEAYPGIRVLAGVEVDILKDGLYLPDECLEKLDIVVASVHQDLGDSKGDLVNRLVRAAANPHVDVIGHPTGRLIGRRPGVQAGLLPLFQVASENGTALEINASPDRLDLPESLVREAREHGCRFAVCTDAHSPEGLESLSLGVYASARRAALPPAAVVNASRDPLLLLKGS